jgi:hypothetical protein
MTEDTYGIGVEGISTYRRNEDTEDRNEAGIRILLAESTGSLDPDNGRPRARGNVGESSDYHAVKLHSPLPKAPPFAKPIVKWE